MLICEVPASASGNLILRARATDGEGDASVTHADAWVATGEDWWFPASDNDRIDLLPEQKRYEPGDTARLQLRTPFKVATALITVEREGVLESFVRTIDRSNPMIELPIKGSYAPNVFVSALIVRGRIADVAPTALVDLAKPAYKMGLAEIRVGWSAHELAVKVAPAQSAYKVRDKASVTISVRRPDGSAPPAGSDVALAAVDEGLLELLPNESWKLLDAMMTRRGEQVVTSTAQMQVIGKRHFGRKAIAAGGGGGRQSARELFDTLLLWQARVPLDAEGNATVDVPLNDSLTSFRIVAIASAGADLFGTGSASIRSTQDLMLLSGLPPLVRELDRFRAVFTVRNASERRIRATLAASIAAGRQGRGCANARRPANRSRGGRSAGNRMGDQRAGGCHEAGMAGRRDRGRRSRRAPATTSHGTRCGSRKRSSPRCPSERIKQRSSSSESRSRSPCSARPTRSRGAAASTCGCRPNWRATCRASASTCPGTRTAASSSARRSRSGCAIRSAGRA